MGLHSLRMQVVPLLAGKPPALEMRTPSQPRPYLAIGHALKDATQHLRVLRCRESHGEPGTPTIVVACGAPVQKRCASQHAHVVAARELSAQPAGVQQGNCYIQYLKGCAAAAAAAARWVTICRVCHRFLLENEQDVSVGKAVSKRCKWLACPRKGGINPAVVEVPTICKIEETTHSFHQITGR